MDSVHHVTGPAFSVDYSMLDCVDQGKPNIYSQRILCFGLPPSADYRGIPTILRHSLVETVKEIPILAGVLTPLEAIEGQQKGRRKIQPGGTVAFTIKDLTESFSYVQFRDRSFPQAELDATVLCPTPALVGLDSPCPVMAVQVNIVRGGILLVVSIIHFGMDGTGITTVLKLWSDKCRQLQQVTDSNGVNGAPHGTSFALPATAFDKSPLAPRPGIKGDIARHPSYTYVPGDAQANTKFMKILKTPTVTALYYFSADALRSLALAATQSTTPTSLAPLKTTIHDAVCALIWRCVMVARQRTDRVKDTIIELSFPVDFRSRIKPPLPAEYIGNAIYTVNARESLAAMHADDSLARMAQAVRKAILSVDTELIQDYIGMYTSVANINNIGNAMSEHMLDRLIFITSYYRFPMHSFDWGPALRTFNTLRLPKQGMLNGFVAVFPALPDGGCEISLALEPEVLEALDEDEMWRRYASVR